ncbi:adenylyltransferase/cytidyltransferase family protein [Desulfonatronum thiodismutans]|uniref:adenylyltransferase/cytidyltransferase family protein n=1 Tax=Desulfonatronum thiodismutans TaxID=159290 RepID=UPI0004ABDCC1|nr:adenylyltransferase/cytidyltransferase family protein [Desulfonatronum thiodismutans]
MTNEKPKRIMVDMSATLLHHGHIRILKAAKAMGTVVVALTIDEDVKAHKGYLPELRYEERREVLEAIRYVDEVVPTRWLIDEAFLDQHTIDLLVHGDDNTNRINPDRLVVLPRTQGISSNLMRCRVLESVSQILQAREKK